MQRQSIISVQAITYSAELIAAPELAAEDARPALPGLSQGKRYDIAVQLLHSPER